MTKIARIADKQQVTLSDFQNIAQDPRDTLDAVVKTAIEEGAKYAGGSVVKTATTKVTVGTPLYLYKQGAVHSRDDLNGIEIDLLSLLPIAGSKRIVAITAQAQTADDETEERDFEVDGTVFPPVVEADATPTRVWRRVNVGTVAGTSAPDPVRPAVDAALTIIAYVTLTSTEVSTVEQVETNRIKSLGQVNGRLEGVEDWRSRTSPIIDGLRSDVAKLSSASKGLADRRLLSYVLEQVARLNEKADVGESAAFSKTDFFLDLEDSDTDHVNYLAKVEEGVRFDDANRDSASLALSNPGDTRVVVHGNGLLLPKYREIPAVSVWGKDTEVALSNAGSQTIEYRKRTVSRARLRFGPGFTVCTNSQWWQTGRYDSANGVFSRDGDTWRADFVQQHPSGNPNHGIYRLYKVWVDTYEEAYWDPIVVTASYTGNVAAQTALMPRAGWLTSLNIGFSRVDTAGDVRVLICRVTESGTPDPKNVLVEVTVPRNNLKTFPEKTKVTIGPVQVDGGTRYGVIIQTAGNHWLALTENNKYAQGSYFTSTDGAWFQGDISRDMAIEWNFAEFEAPRLVIDLDDWNLDGGITGLDLQLEAIGHGLSIESNRPQLSNITFEVKSTVTPWTPIAASAASSAIFNNQPASLDARMVLQGTTEFMPGIWLTTSKVVKHRPRTTFTHISEVHTVPVNTDEVEVIAYLEGYEETPHNCTCKLRVGAGYTTIVNPTATTDETMPDGSIKRRFLFTGLTPTTTFKRQLEGATTSALSVYHVAVVTNIAYPA